MDSPRVVPTATAMLRMRAQLLAEHPGEARGPGSGLVALRDELVAAYGHKEVRAAVKALVTDSSFNARRLERSLDAATREAGRLREQGAPERAELLEENARTEYDNVRRVQQIAVWLSENP